jgi:hypothetical protein
MSYFGGSAGLQPGESDRGFSPGPRLKPPVPSGGNSPESAYFGRLLSPRVRIFSDKRVWVLKRRLRWKRQATHLLCFILEPEQVLA